MRNRRGALTALLLAGAAYAWQNRDKLAQQLGSLRQSYGGRGTSRNPSALPDLSGSEQRDFSTRPYEAQRGGSVQRTEL